jgi:hypothetical protein
MEVYEGVNVYIPISLTSAVVGDGGVSFSHLQLYSQGNRPQYPSDRKQVDPRAGLDNMEKRNP